MHAKGITTLLLPVRRVALLHYLGRIGLALAGLSVIPLLVAGFSGDFAVFWRFGVLIAVLLPLSLYLKQRPRPADLQVNEGLVITASVFILSPFMMAFPLAGAGLSYGQAVFEAISAITTTGLSTLPGVEDKSVSFLFTRAWMQWYGGLGIVVLLPLWIEPGPAARRFLGLEQVAEGDLLTSAHFYARRVVIVYLLLTAGGFLLIWLLGAAPFPALLHTLAAVSTGGFSSFDNGLAVLDQPAAAAVMLVSVLGALPFVVYLQALRGKPQRLFTDLQVRSLLVAGLLGTFSLTALLHWQHSLDWSTAWFQAAILALSAQTTTGFSALEPGTLDNAAKYLLILMMVTGGSLGSTAGGIKLIRLLIFFKLARLLVQRAALPRAAWVAPQLGGLALDDGITVRVMLLMLLFVLVIGLSWIPFLLAGVAPLDALFEVVSAVGTVGLSAGVSRPDLAPALQGILCIDMWLGRLEIIALLVVISPATWHHHKESTA